MGAEAIYAKGLEGVIAGETSISHVEGDIGRLSYRGVDINELIQWPYLDVLALVLTGKRKLDSEVAAILKQGALSTRERACLAAIGTGHHPMRMLQAMLPLLDSRASESALTEKTSEEAIARGAAILAKMPTLIATYHAQQLGKPDPEYHSDEDYLANYLRMFTGEVPNEEALNVFRTVQILQLEHSYNAGTFTALVAASTLAPVDSVMSAGVGALFGTLHGGADEAALRDAKSVGTPDKAAEFVEQLLARKGKLMGMGHREYRLVDPRAKILKPLAKSLCAGTEHENTYATLEALEVAFNKKMQEKGKEVWANLEFYKGPVYEALGIPAEYFTATFAISRAVGWLAHFIESRQDNRIIRPKAAYIGKLPGE
ncbi:MAG: citrate/2-methylcitrate synthase [Pseudomonadales bacterium]